MKKLICLLLSLAMLACLVSCGASETAAVSESAAPAESAVVSSEPEAEPEPEEEPAPAESAEPEESEPEPETVQPIDLLWVETGDVYTAEDGTELVNEGWVEFQVTDADTDPVLQTLQDNLDAVTAEMQERMSTAEEFAADDYKNGMDAFPYEDTYTCVMYRNDSKVLSMITFETYYAGGAHGSYVGYCYSFDAATGELITADMLGEEFAARVEELVLQQCEENPERDSFMEGYADTVAQLVRESTSICFTDDGILVHINTDMIAPYALGALDFDISYDEINDVLPAAYCG